MFRLIQQLRNQFLREKKQFRALILFSFGMIVMTEVLQYTDRSIFQKILDNFNPLLTITGIVLLGWLCFTVLISRGWFHIWQPDRHKGLLRWLWLVIPFACVTIAVDLNAPFPEDINVLLPEALLYYPALGFIGEIVFHVVPLTLLLLLLSAIFKNKSQTILTTISVILVAIVEAAFHTIPMLSHFPAWAVVVVFLNLYLFAFVQLQIFSRYDFVTMFVFRLAYYLLWHFVWGYLRLEILF